MRRTSGAADERQRFTISFAGFNRPWAAWIGDQLESQGCRVTFQRWDPPSETGLEEALADLLLADGQIIVVLSDWYFQMGPRTNEAWNQALRTVAAPQAHRFVALSVTTARLPTATAAFGGAVELWGIGAREARRRLLSRLALPLVAQDDPSSTGNLRPGARFPYDQPRVWGGVPRRNIRFTGRENALNDVYHRLQGSAPGTAIVTLLGMSGVGKTQAAAEYVYRFGSEYDAVWWVPADQRGTLRQRLAELAPALGLTTGPEYGERLRAVRDSLRRGDPYARWLLILDGADDPQAIADLLPNGPGHVLITSQNREWGEYHTHLMEVPVYDRDESIAFVRRRARRITAEEADALAEALGDHPLALDQTAGSLSDSTMPVEAYIELLRSGEDLEVGLRIAPDFQMSYYTAFSILLNRLRETVPAAVDMLRLCSFFAPGPVPLRLLQDVPARDLPEQLADLMSDPLLWNAAISKLVQYSVVSRDESDEEEEPNSEEDTIYLHRMVHQTVRAGMSEEDREVFSRVVRRALTAADPRRPSDTRLWPRFAEIVPHLEPSDALRSTHRETQRLIFNCLSYLYLSGEYPAGIQLAERADLAWREVLGEDHPLVSDLAANYATMLRAVGDVTRTEQINRDLIRRLTAERGPRDLGVLRATGGLAADLRALARFEEALTVSQEALDGYRELVGDLDTRTLSAQNNLAVCLRLLGRYPEALDLDRRTLEDRREVLRPRHNWSLSSESNYALDLRLLGRYDEALSIQERNAEAQRLVMGPENPQTLRAELNLALCHHRLGDRAAAQVLLATLLERAERVLGEDSPATLRIAVTYAFVQREQGDLDRARAVGEAAMNDYRRTLGDRHPYTIGTTVNHALVLRAAGERGEARTLIENGLTAMTEVVGPDHPWTLGVGLNAGVGRNLDGDLETAAELSRDLVRRSSLTLGRGHPLSLSCQVALAADLRGLRNRAEADEVEEAALNGLIGTLGTHHVHTVSARSRVRPYWDFEPLMT